MAKFPTDEWLVELKAKLNNDERYERIAQTWEGDMMVIIEAGGNLIEFKKVYLDLWHGKCRSATFLEGPNEPAAAISLTLPYENGVKLLGGELEVMQALLTRKIGVKGNMALLMRNVPTVLDFVRCCKEITDGFI